MPFALSGQAIDHSGKQAILDRAVNAPRDGLAHPVASIRHHGSDLATIRPGAGATPKHPKLPRVLLRGTVKAYSARCLRRMDQGTPTD